MRRLALTLLMLCSIGIIPAGCSLLRRVPRAEAIPLRLTQAVVLSLQSQPADRNEQSYFRVFEAMGLGVRATSPSELEGLGALREQLILAVPARAAHALSNTQVEEILRLVETGATVVSEEITPLSERLGFRASHPVNVTELQEVDCGAASISWEPPTPVSPLVVPRLGAVLTREASTGAALAALLPYGQGWCLLMAAELDPVRGEGYLRFPFLPQQLRKAGVRLPFRGERLAALFDYGFRSKQDPEALAKQWRRAGIKAIHAGAWAFYDPDPARDSYLERMIAACHSNGVLVYAWLELPHVSERFWDAHPAWREKTATGSDARLDWRYLMNLKDPACFKAISDGLRRMLGRFGWDGVNSAELYFDSPAGPDKPVLLTPFNARVRDEYRLRNGIDPVDFLRADSAHFWRNDSGAWDNFVAYRVELERELNERVLRELSGMKNALQEPLDLAVTYVDDIYDTRMREAVGADVRGMMPLLEKYDFTLIMEDPFTLWHLGPQRYSELASSYGKLTKRTSRLGIDINIVDRPNAHPTQKQTGTEFLQLFFNAGRGFETVLVYSENTIYDWDLEVVANSLATDVTAANSGTEVRVSSQRPLIFRTGAAAAEFLVDGKPWPCAEDGDVLLTAGDHRVSATAETTPHLPCLIGLNGELLQAARNGEGVVTLAYRARPHGVALFDRAPKAVMVDGSPLPGNLAEWVMLPGGTHQVRVSF